MPRRRRASGSGGGLKRARAEYDHRAYLIEWDNMTGGEPRFDPAGAEREFAKKAYESEDWSLGNILSWIAFGDWALICRFEPRWAGGYWSKARWREARHFTSRQRLMLYRQRPTLNSKRRPMIIKRPDAELLAALKANRLTAIRDGQELPALYWFGKDVRYLKDDLRFRRAEAIKCRAVDSTPREPASLDQLAEWIFARHVRGANPFDKRYSEAMKDNTIEGFKKADFRIAYRRVYETEPHRPPATGWPLRGPYRDRVRTE